MGAEKPSQPLSRLRLIAAEILAEVYHSEQSLEESVTRVLTRKSAKTFPEFDRSWLFEVTSGVLRFRGRIDYIIDTYALKKKPTGLLRRILQIGVFQLLGQETESALIVNECVDAVRSAEGDQPSKFANAILRKVSESRADWRNWKVTEASPFEEQLAWCSMPEWLFKKLRKERGSPWIFAFSESVLTRPRIWYRTKTETIMLDKGFRGDEPEGFVQDISNQKLAEEVVQILKARFPDGNPKILDLCSAPGGKSLALAYSGYSVIATDLSEERMQRVTENRSRLKLQDQIEIKPYEEVTKSDEKFDLIWIDAPCSSIGIIRRHPEIKWNRNFEDVEKIVPTQTALQEWAKAHLTPNGVIVYSTCSMLAVENKPLESMKVLQAMEWVPQTEPQGDGIYAMILSN
jgi:16S rRNA (cytosine967-C5)-methyltransferase